MVGFTSIHVGVIVNPVWIQENINSLYGSPPGEEQEVVGGEEGIVIEPVVGAEEETVIEPVCMV